MPVDRSGRALAVIGGALSLGVLVLAAVGGGAAWRAWLAAAVLCASVPTGALALSMMLRLIPGSWRQGLARPLAAGRAVLPVGALAMLPVLVAPGVIYAWVGAPGPGAFRAIYLSPAAFALRGLAWFLLLGVLALRLRPGRSTAATAAIGLLVLVPAALPISADWLMSLDPRFVSSGFGLYVLAIQLLLTLGLAIVVSDLDALEERTRDVLGGVLFTAIVLWAYVGFMQYFIIWSNDLPPTVAWFLRRGGAWAWLAWIAIALKIGPGLALMWAHVRRSPAALRACAALTAAGAVPEVAWLVLPAPGPTVGPIAAAVFVAGVIALGATSLGAVRLAARSGAMA